MTANLSYTYIKNTRCINESFIISSEVLSLNFYIFIYYFVIYVKKNIFLFIKPS